MVGLTFNSEITAMAKQHLLKIGPNERYWAHPPAERSWQRFWGTYELQASTGVYVECGSDPIHLENFAKAFQKLPAALRALARDWEVTFNFAPLFTASGNASTFYADFSQTTRQAISPHIEMGRTSLAPDFIVAHLTHELGHLYWRTRDLDQRNLYRQFMRESCGVGTVELTEYVQENFQTYQRVAKLPSAPDWQKTNMFERWVEESLCDTLAILVEPAYPSFDPATTVDLATRRMVINLTFGLSLSSPSSGPWRKVLTQ